VIKVGLTGGVGSGKSEAARLLAARGAVVVDADRLAREVVAPGTPGLRRVVEVFGEHVLDADGSLDRPAMAALVFADLAARVRLEAIVHPLVGARAAELMAAADADSVVVYDVPLLVERSDAAGYDLVVVVDASDEVRIDRLVRLRGWTEADARARMSAQAGREERLAVADVVLANEGSLEELTEQVDALWQSLCQSLRQSPPPPR